MGYRPSLAVKMVLAITLVSGAVALMTHAASSRQLAKAIADLETARATGARVVVEAEVNDEIKRITTIARVLRKDPALIQAAAENASFSARRERLKRELDALYPQVEVDILEVADRDERVLYRAHAPEVFGDKQNIWGIAEAIAGKDSLVTAVGRSGPAIRAIFPLGEGRNVAAALTVGILLDQRFARRVATATNTQISVITPDGDLLAASSPQEAVAAKIDKGHIAASMRDKHKVAHTLPPSGDETTAYFAGTMVDQTYVWLVTVDSSEAIASRAQAEAAALRNSLAAGLLGALLLGWLAHVHARRIAALQRETEETVRNVLGAGGASRSGSSELESLGESVRLMTSRLLAHAAELFNAREAAEAATRSKSNFLAVMSHEIRTPLNGMLGMTELLLESQLDARQRRLAEAAFESGAALRRVIDDVLDFSKIEAERMELTEADFNLRELVDAVLDLFVVNVMQKRVKLTAHVEDSLPSALRGDGGRVRQILINLVGNALKFTEAGEVSLRVSRAREEDDRLWVRFEVKDSGIGIEPAAQARIFDAFTQADDSATRKQGGTGLGLAICRRLVELMGGKIGVESEPGSGSCFWFVLPFALVDEADRHRVPAAVNADLVALRDALRRRRPAILLAEDQRVNIQVAVGMLELAGCETQVTTDGVQALAALAERRYDLALIDCQMPQLGGFELIRRLREDERATGAPRRQLAIALTANAFTGAREQCIAAGFDDYLAKPIAQRELLSTLARWLLDARPPDGASRNKSSADEESALDNAALEALRELDRSSGRGLFADILATYLRTAPAEVANATQALDRDDLPAAAVAAHNLASSSDYVGAAGVSRTAREIVHAARTNESARLPELAARLASEFDRAAGALRGLMGEVRD